jgi:hypothetical protein
MKVLLSEPGTGVPPQALEYHFHCAWYPRLVGVTPFSDSVMFSPRQMLSNGLFEVNVMPFSEECANSVMSTDPDNDEDRPSQRESATLSGE